MLNQLNKMKRLFFFNFFKFYQLYGKVFENDLPQVNTNDKINI